eukprot:528315-Pyramimonas_sp.AAC.1
MPRRSKCKPRMKPTSACPAHRRSISPQRRRREQACRFRPSSSAGIRAAAGAGHYSSAVVKWGVTWIATGEGDGGGASHAGIPPPLEQHSSP